MEEITVMYLIGDLSRRLGKLTEASKWISKVIITNASNNRLKEKSKASKRTHQTSTKARQYESIKRPPRESS